MLVYSDLLHTFLKSFFERLLDKSCEVEPKIPETFFFYAQTPTSQITKHSLLKKHMDSSGNHNNQHFNPETEHRRCTEEDNPHGTTIVLYATLWGHDACHFGDTCGAVAAPLCSARAVHGAQSCRRPTDTHGDRHG